MTHRIEGALRGVVADLEEMQRKFALVGGFAVSARCEPRTTRDVDLSVLVDGDAEAERVVFELGARSYGVGATVEHSTMGRLATARMVSPPGVVVDLLFASCGFEPEVVRGAEVLEILPGLRTPVATVAHLIAMKVLSRNDKYRPQDRMDLIALLAIATPPDLLAARAALKLCTDRGFHRERELDEELCSLQEELTVKIAGT